MDHDDNNYNNVLEQKPMFHYHLKINRKPFKAYLQNKISSANNKILN